MDCNTGIKLKIMTKTKSLLTLFAMLFTSFANAQTANCDPLNLSPATYSDTSLLPSILNNSVNLILFPGDTLNGNGQVLSNGDIEFCGNLSLNFTYQYNQTVIVSTQNPNSISDIGINGQEFFPTTGFYTDQFVNNVNFPVTQANVVVDFDPNINSFTFTGEISNITFEACQLIITEVCIDSAFSNPNDTTITDPCNGINADFSTQLTANNGANFTPNYSSNTANYYWEFGDSIAFSSNSNPTYNFDQPGTYTVCLIISDPSLGCNDNNCQSITVYTQNPNDTTIGTDTTITDPCNGINADFSTQLTANSGANFTPNYSSNTVNYYWEFGDSLAFSSNSNPTYNFDQPGTYTVCLVISDPTTGCDENNCENIIVYTQNPNDTIIGTDTTITTDPCDGINANFSAQLTANNGANFTPNYSSNTANYYWEFGDSLAFSSNSNPTYNFDQPGTYTVCLVISDPAIGCNDNNCQSITVYSQNPNDTTIGTDTTITTDPCDGINADFSAQLTANNGANFTPNYSSNSANYYWEFGDSLAFSSNSNPTYNFDQPGTYTVCLVISDPAIGCNDNNCQSITVYSQNPNDTTIGTDTTITTDPCDGINADFSAQQMNSNEISFTTDYNSNTALYQWIFGDSTAFSSEMNPTYDFGQSGSHSVCLSVSDSSGYCFEINCQNIFVPIQNTPDSMLSINSTILTPNNDGQNDFYEVECSQAQILDRFGNILFTTPNTPNYQWIGLDAVGSELPIGQYIIVCPAEQSATYVTLIR